MLQKVLVYKRLPGMVMALFWVVVIPPYEVQAAAAGCAKRGDNPLTLWRSLFGGTLQPAQEAAGPAREGPLSFLAPRAVAARGTDVYVFDAGHHAVLHLDTALNRIRVFAVLPAGTTESDLYVHDDLTVYVVDSRRAVVQEHDVTGRLVRRYRDPNLGYPIAVVADSANSEVFVADKLGNYVLIFSRLGLRIGSLGARRKGPYFEGVSALAQHDNKLYVVDGVAPVVHMFDLDGGGYDLIGEDALRLPRSIAVDAYRRVFMVDDRSIKVFSFGQFDAVVGSGGKIRYGDPTDIWASDGFLYVADALNAQILMLTVLPPCS